MAGVRSKQSTSGKFIAWYKDANGKQRFFAATTNRKESLSIANKLEDERRQIKLGYRDAPKSSNKHRSRPFAEVTTEYIAWGASCGGRGGRAWAATHTRIRKAHLEFWKTQLSIDTLVDLDHIMPNVEKTLRELK